MPTATDDAHLVIYAQNPNTVAGQREDFVENLPKSGAHIGAMMESQFSEAQHLTKYTPKGFKLFVNNREKSGRKAFKKNLSVQLFPKTMSQHGRQIF